MKTDGAGSSIDSSATAAFTGAEFRSIVRSGKWTAPTVGAASRYLQAHLVVLPASDANEFAEFCELNGEAFPVLESGEAGAYTFQKLAAAMDVRTDIPSYSVYRFGELVDQPTDIVELWRDDLVAFCLGSNFSVGRRLASSGISARQFEIDGNVPMYKTNINCEATERLSGPLVVNMRPVPMDAIAEVVRITGRIPQANGSPIHTGAPEAIGIFDLSCPDFGAAVEVLPGEIPVFWACGVTAQVIAMESKLDLMITESPGHMLVSDVLEAYVDRAFPAT